MRGIAGVLVGVWTRGKMRVEPKCEINKSGRQALDSCSGMKVKNG